jgi:2-haloacid dehalogenase
LRCHSCPLDGAARLVRRDGGRIRRQHAKERGFRLYALTNWSADTFHHAQAKFEFLDWFEDIVVSGRIGMIKPDPAIFRHAVEQCRLDPARTLFIDDSAKNTVSAATVGFQVHHFTAADRLRDCIAPLLGT